MRVQTFKNGKGLIYGEDPKRIRADKGGVLNIGGVEVGITADTESVLPLLFNGSVGHYRAAFAEEGGAVYDLGMVEVRGGRIVPPSETGVELAELRYRLDEMQDAFDRMQEKLSELANIFDTNSLNFLIK